MTDNLYMTGATPDECWPLVRDFHYSRRMPTAIRHCFAWREPGGLFGDTGEPQAVIIFGQPVNRNLPQNAIELQRLVRKPGFDKPLSKFIGWALRWLKKNENYLFSLSYADTAENHHGGIYQATNWIYCGQKGETWSGTCGYRTPYGQFIHNRTCNAKYGTNSKTIILEKFPDWEPVDALPKHFYIFPLRQKTKSIFYEFEFEKLPYPKPDAEARK